MAQIERFGHGIPFRGAGFVSAQQDLDWMITVRPRLGVGFFRLLIYGAGGVASMPDED